MDFLAVHPLKAAHRRHRGDAGVREGRGLPRRATSASAWWPWAACTSSATERHEARRIDNQLRGRAGRQGDPGSSRFYLSLEDDLMRIFGSDRISGLMLKLGMEEGVPIEHGMVTRSIERAQKQVEAQNFAVRKHLLEYDDVMNKQRKAVYDMRRMILEGKDTREPRPGLAEEVLDWYLDSYCAEKQDPGEWNLEGLQLALKETFGLDVPARRAQAHGPRRDGRDALRSSVRSALRGEGAGGRPRADALPPAHDHAPDRGRAVEGPPLLARPPEGGHRPARLRPARSRSSSTRRSPSAMFQALMDRIDEEILRWIFLYQPVPTSGDRGRADARRRAGGRPRGPPARARPAPSACRRARAREPELALAGARAMPRT